MSADAVSPLRQRMIEDMSALRRPDLAIEMYHLKEPQKIPLVISPDETKRLLAMAGSLKVHVLLALSCGARFARGRGGAARDIDSAQNIIRIVHAKARKDHPVMLSPEMLDLLWQRWKVRPIRYDTGCRKSSAGCFLAASQESG